MAVKKRTKIVGVSFVVLLLVVAGAVPVYRAVTWVDVDLGPLADYGKTESYEALIARVQGQAIGAEGFTFVVLGDTRTNFFKARQVLESAASHGPAFILSNGDVVRRGEVDEYINHHLRLVEEIAPVPFIPAPGNHERGPNYDFGAFKAIYGDVQFSFDYGGCRFIGVNNGDRTKLSGSDIRFIEGELSKPGADRAFIIFHLPPEFLESAVESEDRRGFVWNAKKLHGLCREYGVDMVFAGHVHGFASEVFDGVRYVITGGAGANLTDKLGPDGNVYNYVLIRVTPDGVERQVYKQRRGEWVAEEIP